MARPLLWIGLAALALCLLWMAQRMRQLERRSGVEQQFWLLCQEESTAEARTAAFLALVAAGNKEWRSARLYGLNFAGAFLAESDLRHADFGYTVFKDASLAGARLVKSRFHQADLSGADLSRADLSGAEFYRARMRGVKLSRANLRGAILQTAEAASADLQGADLSDADLLMADLSGANLAGANLSGANLSAAVLRGANLFLARLSYANLKDADFTDANWWRARGLTSQQLARLSEMFAPGDRSPANLREDYRTWLRDTGTGR